MLDRTTYRHPGLLAKIITTLDVLSGGRALLGLGAAWDEKEAVGLGVPFPSTKERFERLEETLQVVRQMWSDDEGPYDGTHYQQGRTLNRPQPIRKPPIMIGGTGEKKTLRFVAKYADACNLVADPADASGTVQKLKVLREHCQNEDTSYDRLSKTITCMAPADPAADGADFVDQMRAFADAGIDEVVQLRNPTEGRAYYDRRKAEGKTSMEAMRALKRRLSNIVYKTMLDDTIAHAAAGSRTGPGGQRSNDSDPSAAGSQPHTNSSDKPLPGPARTQPKTPLPAAS